MLCYKNVTVNNLEKIQQDVIAVLPAHIKTNNYLGFVVDPVTSTRIFLGLESIRTLLASLNLLGHVQLVAVITKLSQVGGDIHVDNGPYRLSLNIPITGCHGTHVNFYQAQSAPNMITKGQNTYYYYSEDQCQLDTKLDTGNPCIIDTTVPHSVHNPNNETRIMLLIRLKPYITFDYFDKLVP